MNLEPIPISEFEGGWPFPFNHVIAIISNMWGWVNGKR